jgi:hypothetical protein
VLLPLVVALQAQSATVPRVELTTPVLTVAADFSQLRGVRELADGRLLVSDRLEQKVLVLTPRDGKSTVIGRIGEGPVEYRLPTAIYATPGDSSLLIDDGNGRVGVIGPDLKIKRTFNLMIPNVGTPLLSRGRDAQGRWLIGIPAWIHNRGPAKDSVVIVRFDPRSNAVDTLAVLKGSTPPPHPEYSPEPRIPMVIFAPQDVWAASSDGAIAVVRSNDYHVEWIMPDGTRAKGQRVAHDVVTVTEAEKTAYARRFTERSNVGGKGGGLQASSADMMTPDAIARLVKATTWAEKKGAFTDAAPIMAADGSVWVERSGPMGSAPVYDVFNRKGERVRSVQLAKGRRLAAVGKATVYAISVDGDGLEHLELYQLPR